MMEDTVQVLIPAMNRHDRLEVTLDSLRRCDMPKTPQVWKMSILVCDDGSDPPLKDLCEKYGADWVRHGKNYGTSQSRRTLYALAQGTYIWLLDSDMYVHPLSVHGYLSKVREGLAVAGRMNHMEDDEADRVVAMPVEQRLAYLEARDNKRETRHDWPCTDRLSRPWQWAFTGNQCIWGSDFRKSGGLPHDYTGYGHDDTGLVYNICKKAGVSYVTSDVARAWHLQRDLFREGNAGYGYPVTIGMNSATFSKHVAREEQQ